MNSVIFHTPLSKFKGEPELILSLLKRQLLSIPMNVSRIIISELSPGKGYFMNPELDNETLVNTFYNENIEGFNLTKVVYAPGKTDCYRNIFYIYDRV